MKYEQWGAHYVAIEDFVVSRDAPFSGNSDLQVMVVMEDGKEKKTNLSALFRESKLTGKLLGYRNVTSKPYWDNDPSHLEDINIWSPFPLRFVTKSRINVKDTAIFVYLWEILARKNKQKMKFLMSCLACKLKFPEKKLEKFLILYGEKGCGKSSLRYLLRAIYGPDKVLFFDNFAHVMAKSNHCWLGKLWIIVDDQVCS
jgi:hypothetical protein